MVKETIKKYKTLISISILLILIIAFLYYLINNFNDFKQLSLVNPLYIIPLVLIILATSITNGLILKFFLSPFKIKLRMKEWFGLSIVTTFYNTITPLRGGMMAKAVYLKKKHKFSYTNFLATYSGTYFISFLASSLLGLISLYFLYKQSGIFNIIVLGVFLAFFIPSLIIIALSPKFPQTKYNIINKFIDIINGWHNLKENKMVIFQVTIITLVQFTLGAISSMISYSLFGINLNIFQAVFLVSLGTLAGAVSITPGSLGIAEAVGVFSALVIGITPAQSLTVAILNRAVSTITIFILGPIFSYLLIKKELRNNKKIIQKRK